ncbi:hypothetical protein B0H14DRAFT_3434148 [Mycena olivaceomarginata]|nr:hypothetical protein B0H14DRAFT_3434148 [Mycena olivaceomarginata]
MVFDCLRNRVYGGFMGISTVPSAHVQPRENGMLIYDSRPLRSSISPRFPESPVSSFSAFRRRYPFPAVVNPLQCEYDNSPTLCGAGDTAVSPGSRTGLATCPLSAKRGVIIDIASDLRSISAWSPLSHPRHTCPPTTDPFSQTRLCAQGKRGVAFASRPPFRHRPKHLGSGALSVVLSHQGSTCSVHFPPIPTLHRIAPSSATAGLSIRLDRPQILFARARRPLYHRPHG